MKKKFIIHGIFILVFLASYFVVFQALALGKEKVGPVVPVDVQTVHPYTGPLLAPAVVQSLTIGEPGAKFILLHLTDFSIAQGDEVIVLDKNGRVSESLGSQSKSEFWTLPVFSDTVQIQLLAQPGNSGYGFRIDKIGIALLVCAPDTIPCQGTNNHYICPYGSASLDTLGKSVAKLVWPAFGNVWVGSGWIYKQSDQLITNYHNIPGCPWDPQILSDASAVFDFYRQSIPDCHDTIPVSTHFTQIIQCDTSLDFSVLQMQDPPGRPPLVISLVDPGLGDMVFMIHHSSGCEQQRADGQVVDTEYEYYVDLSGGICREPCLVSFTGIRSNIPMTGGSSGSPVFNGTGEVIALHHSGPECSKQNGVPIQEIVAAGPGCDYVLPSVCIPTLTQWGLLILVALIVFSTWVVLRRRKAAVSPQ